MPWTPLDDMNNKNKMIHDTQDKTGNILVFLISSHTFVVSLLI